MSGGSIVVVNAGSSSLKFSLFRLDTSENLQLAARGQIDGIGTRPRLKAKDAAGGTLIERDLALAEAREVKDAIVLAGAWLREQFADAPLRAVGHRVVHGGAEYSQPILIDENDMRLLLESAEPRARLAVDYFVHYVAKEIGALAAVLGGLDGLVLTAGIGENSPEIRARILAARTRDEVKEKTP